MQVDVIKLIQGLNNSIFIKEQVEAVSRYRLDICNTCKHYSPNADRTKMTFLQKARRDKFCTDCDCNMYLKSRSLAAKCPLGYPRSNFPNEKSKWPQYTTDDKIAEKLLETKELMEEIVDYKTQLQQNKIDEHGS
jgi:hypothetical protein